MSAKPNKIRVLIIEDNRLLREGLTAMLNEQPDITVAASTGNGDAVAKAMRLKPHAVVLDLGLPGTRWQRAIELIQAGSPETKVIGMDLLPVQTDLVQYVEAGVSGFILKDATFDDFLRTIRVVARGGMVLPPPLTGSLFSQIVDRASRKGGGNPFRSVRMTNREREVVELIADGLSNKEIAHRLNLATDTVKSHVHNILEKLALHTRLEIASYAHADKDRKAGAM
jgi:DNA-binding NarL/FixJ family response regulator